MNNVAHALLRAASTLVSTLGLLAAQQTTFDFHSNFWVNLHHFLYQQAIAKSPEQSGSEAWNQALDVYRTGITKHELLSRDIAGINIALSKIENAESLQNSGIDAELTQTLERAAPVYKTRWWPQHNRQNLAWIDAATPLVAKYEAVMKKDLAAAYQTPWPSTPIRTDVAEYAKVALDFGRRTCRLFRIVRELHGRPAVDRCHLADDRDRIEIDRAIRCASHEIVGQVGAPAKTDPDAPVKVTVGLLNGPDIHAVGKNQ